MSAYSPVRLTLALRLVAGAVLAAGMADALASPYVPVAAKLAACLVIALTLWRAEAGLVGVVATAPAGLLLATPPVRAAELLAWAFLAAWLLRLWRPLGGTATDAAPLRASDRAVATDAPVPPKANRRAAVDGAVLPAALYAACAVGSWAGYTIRGAPGVPPHRVPLTLARTLDSGHLIFASPEPETLTLLTALAGLALFAAAACIARDRPDVRRHVATALVAASAALATLTVAEVLRQWAGAGYGAWFLLRYVRGERFSFHLQDLNAAGSFLALGILAALAMAAGEGARRWIWIAALVPVAPALFLSGSRSATVAVVAVGGVLLARMRRGASPRVAPARSIALVVIIVATGVAVAAASLGGDGEQGTASGSLRLRSQFLVTSARMFASAPVFGVGIGHYHERSNEFMPPALREVYRHENAHNYFAQQFAELGILGGALFVWLAASALSRGWRAARLHGASEPALVGLFAGAIAYVVTCVTGHPLLVPEAALPFWGAFGALAAAAPRPVVPRPRRAAFELLAAAVLLAVALGIALEARRYTLAAREPGERGFYGLETTGDGRPFVWMTRHGIFHVGPQPGTLVIPVRAPGFLTRAEPFYVEVDVAGRRAGTYEVFPDRWTDVEIRLRDRASTPFRRVDVRANQSWSPVRDRGAREDDEPRSVMVGETRWTQAGGR